MLLLSIVVGSFLKINIAYAQGTDQMTVEIENRWDMPSIPQQNEAIKNCRGDEDDKGICLERLMIKQVNTDIPGSLLCGLGGMTCGAKNEAEEAYYRNKSVLAQSSQMLAYLYTEPGASTGEYLAYMFNKAGLVPKTYAQGLTYSRLLPILPIWKVFRDIAYALLSIVMLLIGLMIMFRSKINPQTVANVENTIPKVVVTIILITLSFPIAGLIIDFMYVMIAVAISVIGKAVGDPNLSTAISDYTTGGFWTLFGKTVSPALQFGGMSGIGGNISNVAAPLMLLGIPLLASPVGLPLVIGGGVLWALSGIGTAIAAGDAGAGLMAFLSPIFVLLIFIVLLFSVFKIFFMLLSNYIQILIYIVFAPAILLINAVPGRNTFSNWWKTIASNMLSFVVTAVMLYLAWAIASLIQNVPFWTPPFIIHGAGAPQMAIGLISLGIVLLIPQMVQKVKDMFGAKPAFQVGPSMIFAPVTGAAMQGVGLAGQFNQASMGWDAIKRMVGKK